MMTPPTLSEHTEPIPIFSFADGEMGALGSWIIRNLERFTGQPRIKQLYLDYVDDQRPHHLFWQDAVARLNISVNRCVEAGATIPKNGRLLVIANHPFGVVDGLILCSEISKIRPDYKIITHEVLRQAPAVKHQILPIDFTETPAALTTNMQTRHDALAHLKNDGALILFPAGAISRTRRIIGTAHDAEWKPFAARLAQTADTTILPIFFSGQNSFSYMLSRQISQTLGYSLMFHEICRLIGSEITLTIRQPIASTTLAHFANRHEIIGYLRDITYGQDGI